MGAHFNPAVTLTFLRLGRVAPWDAAFYVAAQFAGGVMGLSLAAAAGGSLVGAPSVSYVATVPGPRGVWIAFVVELALACVMMTMVLVTTARVSWLAPFTGLFAGALVAVSIALAAPLSGMSLNPARSFASALLGPALDGLLDLPHRAAPRHAARGRGPPALVDGGRAVRQASPRQRPAVHLSVPVRTQFLLRC